MVSLFLLLGCNLSYIVDLFAALHELASASARTLIKLASSVRALLKPYGDTLKRGKKVQCISNRCKDLFKQKKYFGVSCTLKAGVIELERDYVSNRASYFKSASSFPARPILKLVARLLLELNSTQSDCYY